MKKSRHCSFDMFLQLQGRIRKRLLEYFYRLCQGWVVRRLRCIPLNANTAKEFINRLGSFLNLPDEITVYESEKNQIIAEANRTVAGIYNLLGSNDVILNPVDWHSDFKTGFRWSPGTFYKKYKQEDFDTSSDVKVPRELSRSHHLLKLGQAYRLSGNEQYAEECVKQMNDWIDENPLMYSINWGCTMDVAIRAVNWIWTLGLIIGSKGLDNKTVDLIKVSLYQHGWFIFRNPEKQAYNNHNHYLADLSGQIHLGLLFSDLPEPQKWLKVGINELFREIRLQILPSGMSYERSTNYNRLVLELILVPILLLKNNGHKIPQDIWYRLEKMFEFIMYSLRPDGSSPIIGDQDNGRLLPFGTENLNDFRYLMSLGALIYKRSDFKAYGNGLNAYCMILGRQTALKTWSGIPVHKTDLESKGFPDAGIFILRGHDDYMLFNATGKGLYPELGTGTHTHSDLLSFELFTNGKPFLIDPGSFVYTADAEQRKLFRSTKMHNTVTIDGKSQNEVIKEILWDFHHDAIPEILTWESDDKKDTITAIHNGYARLPEPVFHERTIIFDKMKKKWTIRDTIKGDGSHELEWFFHFDSGIDFDIIGNKVITVCTDKKNIVMTFDHQPGLKLIKDRSYVSKSYGNKSESYVLTASIVIKVPFILNLEIFKSEKS